MEDLHRQDTASGKRFNRYPAKASPHTSNGYTIILSIPPTPSPKLLPVVKRSKVTRVIPPV